MSMLQTFMNLMNEHGIYEVKAHKDVHIDTDEFLGGYVVTPESFIVGVDINAYGMECVVEFDGKLHHLSVPLSELHNFDFAELDARNRVAA